MRKRKSSGILESVLNIGLIIAILAGMFIAIGYVHTIPGSTSFHSSVSLALIGAFIWMLDKFVMGTPKKRRGSRTNSRSRAKKKVRRAYPDTYTYDVSYEDSGF